jgi:carbon-monoxide dehydrogenase large subunit
VSQEHRVVAEVGAFRSSSPRRKEDRRLIVGEGRYVGDLAHDGGLHVAFVRSDIAHGLVGDLDLDEVRTADGVVAVFTAADLDAPDIPSAVPPVNASGMDRPALAKDRVRHVGEAMVMIVAESATAAVDAAGLVWLDIDPLPPVVGARAAATGAILHEAAGTNIVERFELGDGGSGWGHPIEISLDVINQRVAPLPIEPLSATASPDGDGARLVVGHQAPHRLKAQLEKLFGFPIRVIVPDVGGGFGMKARIFPEYVALVAAARKLGRPVRWLQTRRELLMCGTHGRDMRATIRLGGDADGRVRRAHFEMLSSVGAYPHVGAQIATFARLVAQGLYDFETVTIGSTTVVTNEAPIAPYRGAGRPQAAYSVERAIERFARVAGLDPIEVRRRNMFAAEQLPHRTVTGALYDSGDYRAALDEAVRLVGVEAVRAEQDRRRAEGGTPLGIGFGAFIERAGGPLNAAEFGRVEIDDRGDIVVFTGSTSNGQGHETVWAQLAGQVFDVPIDRVRVVAGDTGQVAEGSGSTASRSAQLGGSAVWRCAHRVRDAAMTVASRMLEVAVADLRLEDGAFRVVGVPETSLSLAEVAEAAPAMDIDLADEETFGPGAQTFPYGVHAAVVEVEPETGEVRVIRYVAVDDCGNILNPMIVEGQTHGSVAQGIGQAIFEQITYGSEGQLLTGTLMDYIAPRAGDVPSIESGRIVSPAPSNPLGAKGAAEGGCIGAPPAIVNAVLDALAPFGVEHIDMPLRPQRVWEALQTAEAHPG